jgi:hypothetical protein
MAPSLSTQFRLDAENSHSKVNANPAHPAKFAEPVAKSPLFQGLRTVHQ